MADSVLNGYDDTQVSLMKEECILIDRDDKVTGSASKKTCHLIQNINKGSGLVSLIHHEGPCLIRKFHHRGLIFLGLQSPLLNYQS